MTSVKDFGANSNLPIMLVVSVDGRVFTVSLGNTELRLDGVSYMGV